MRRLISMSTLTLYVKHYKVSLDRFISERKILNAFTPQDDEGREHIDIQQVGSGGFKGNFEERTLTWAERRLEDPVFGPVGTSFLLHSPLL